jgi:hypothetical protein
MSGHAEQEYFADGMVEDIIDRPPTLPQLIRNRSQLQVHLHCRARPQALVALKKFRTSKRSTEPWRKSPLRERNPPVSRRRGTVLQSKTTGKTAGSARRCGGGELVVRGCWRRERDSNPRYGFPYTHFPGVRLQPLGHLSSTRHGLIRPRAFAKRLSGPDRAFPQVSGDIYELGGPAASRRG